MRQPPQPSQSKVDFSTIVRELLVFEGHWRLMILLFVLGVLASIVAYVFARPVYASTAVVRVYRYVDATQVAMQGPAGAREGTWESARTIGGVLTTPFIILEGAKKVGLAGDKTTYRELRDYVVPKVHVAYLDGDLIELSTEAFSTVAVEKLPVALLEAFEESRQKIRMEQREKAIQKYMDELAVMRKRVSEQLNARLQFEEQSALATTQIELERLSDVPVQIVRLKHQIEEMEQTQKVLSAQGGGLGTVGQLSLLTVHMNPNGHDKLETGKLVRPSAAAAANNPVTFQNKTLQQRTEVVIQPGMVEGLAPWKELEKRKRGVEEQLRQERQKYLDDHQVIRGLREELQKIDAGLELELEVARKAFALEMSRLREQLQSFEAKLPEYHKVVKDYDEKKLDYDLMHRSQLAWDLAYEKLAKQIEGFELGGIDGTVRLELKGFTEMRNFIPVSPSKSNLITLGLLLGVGMAVGLPFAINRLDTSVSSLAEFESSLGILGVGLIPRSDPRLLNEINRSPAVGDLVPNALLENFRLVRSSILLHSSPRGGEDQVIMVTSARPGEGKSTLSCNLGWAFASIGEKTLVIDCDLRRGRVHEIASVSNELGMTDLFQGRVSLADCVKPGGAENLWVLPRGHVLQGTTELLNTHVFEGILAELKGMYKRIILDTPPVLGLSETAFLQNHAAGVVLVVRAQKTPRKDVIEAIGNLRKLGAYFYGFVLNDVDFSRRLNSYQYYYYSSNYYDQHWEEQDKASNGRANSKQLI
jgi:succinoglycan biosynthesis transport protein ExoP